MPTARISLPPFPSHSITPFLSPPGSFPNYTTPSPLAKQRRRSKHRRPARRKYLHLSPHHCHRPPHCAHPSLSLQLSAASAVRRTVLALRQASHPHAGSTQTGACPSVPPAALPLATTLARIRLARPPSTDTAVSVCLVRCVSATAVAVTVLSYQPLPPSVYAVCRFALFSVWCEWSLRISHTASATWQTQCCLSTLNRCVREHARTQHASAQARK